MATIAHPLFGECVVLENQAVRAVVSPAFGMSLIELAVDGEPLLDQSRTEPFHECRKGLGPLILPHFNQRKELPSFDTEACPHVPHLRRLGVRDPFQHGVGRYATWRFRAEDGSVTGELNGEDLLCGQPVRAAAGFDFAARVSYRLTNAGLLLELEVTGDAPVEAGIHYYYDLKDRRSAQVQMPLAGSDHSAVFDFEQAHNEIYQPARDGDWVTYTLATPTYVLRTRVRVRGNPEERFDAVVLFSPAQARFVCIEPLSFSQQGQNTRRRIRAPIFLEAERR
jgi:D-hexose-6-phosphate mutarotase